MLSIFQKYIREKSLFTKKDRLLLAVSGGVDSMVLAHLLKKSDYDFAIAHVNFKLRGKASDADEAFVTQQAQKLKVECHTTSFDTEAYAKKNKLSIQMAARELRYAYFESIAQKHHFDYILTAHHHDDAMETFLLNVSRGTGLAGLHGILPINGIVRRPLLFASRKGIESFAKTHSIIFRNDASNAEDKYKRNKIRLKVIPVLKELNPALDKAFLHAMGNIQVAEQIQAQYVAGRIQELTKTINGEISFSVTKLQGEAHAALIMHQLLKPFGFSAAVAEQALRALKSSGAKVFRSATHELIKDRTQCCIRAIQRQDLEEISIDQKTKRISTNGFEFHFELLKGGLDVHGEASKNAGNRAVYLDADKLKYPLLIRAWKIGDAMIPFGMKGRKKVSDMITDAKLSITRKERQLVLICNQKIAWLVGLRSDERFRIKSTTKKVLRISIV